MNSNPTTPDVSPTRREGFEPSIRGRIRGLDELRGIAILLVLFSHYFNPSKNWLHFENVHFGGVGVDLFFLISGFLIGKILIESRGQANYFRTFYIRRVFRIFPLYFLMILAAFALAAKVNPSHLRAAPFYLTFTQNWLFDEARPLANWVSSEYRAIPGLGPLWSLAVEEQFYAVVPWLIACFRPRLLPWMLSAIALLGFWLDISQSVGPEEETSYWFYYTHARLTYFKMQYLALGVLLNVPSRWAFIGPIVVAAFAMMAGTQHWFLLLSWLTMLLMLLSIELAIYHGRYLQNKFLAWCGVVCFGLYVLHIPMQIVFRKGWNYLGLPWWADLVGFGLFLALAFTVAWFSFHFFEVPIQRLRGRFERRSAKQDTGTSTR